MFIASIPIYRKKELSLAVRTYKKVTVMHCKKKESRLFPVKKTSIPWRGIKVH
jgi:hypothetical protein